MHNIKEIRKDIEFYKKITIERNKKENNKKDEQ